MFCFYILRRKNYLSALQNNYEKESDEVYRKQGLKRLNVNPDQNSQK